jgi:hypothetical protein
MARLMCSGEKYMSVFRLYRHIGKLTLAAIYLRRGRVAGRSFSAGAQPLTHVCTVGACGKKLGVGLRRPYRGKSCGGMLEAMARIAPAGGTARSTEA